MMEKVRGVWLTNVDSNVLDSKQNIAEAMKLLADTGFNYVFPVVWNKGYTLYRSKVMQSEFGEEILPNSNYAGRDPFAEVVEEAQNQGLKVIPWFEYGFASSYEKDGGHILAKYPDWKAKDRHGSLLKKNGFEWMNALDPDVQDFMLKLILEVVKNYSVQGIQGDDRLPALPSEGGYDAKTKKLHKSTFGQEPPLNSKDKAWLKWRADILSNFLARLHSEIKAINFELIVSMAPSPFPFGFNEYLQDYPTWLKHNLVDMIHPQLYRRDLNEYKALVDDIADRFKLENTHLLMHSPGVLARIGNYHIKPDDLWQCIKHNRESGLRGEVLFFYQELQHNNGALAKFLQTKKYSEFVFLQRGHEGPDVEAIQKQLMLKGYVLGRTDGKFGSRTESAVIDFQKAKSLSPDGIVGPLTFKKLFS